MSTAISHDEQHAIDRDAQDPLAPYRERFIVPDGATYLNGNPLGLLTTEFLQR